MRARAAAGRVARPHGNADLGKVVVVRDEALPKLGERPLEIALDVVVQRLERRDVEQVNRVRERALEPLGDERVELPQKRRERLAGAGWGEDEGMLAARDRRPSLLLRRARRA
jgi:hypothetical protein